MSVVYLKDMLGSTLPQCLHDVCQVRPHDPIEYIAKWLYRSVDAEIYFYDKAIFVKEVRSMVLELEKENITRKRAIIAHNEKMKRLKAAIFADKEERARLLQKLGLTTPLPSPQLFQSSETEVDQDKKAALEILVPGEFQLDDADRQKPRLESLHSDSMFLSDAVQAVERSKQRADKRLQAIKEVRKHMAIHGLSKAQQEDEEAQRAEFEEKMRVVQAMKKKRIDAEVARRQKGLKKSSGDEDSTSDHDGEVETKSKKRVRSKKDSKHPSRSGTFPRGKRDGSCHSSYTSASEGSSDSEGGSRRSPSSLLTSPRKIRSTSKRRKGKRDDEDDRRSDKSQRSNRSGRSQKGRAESEKARRKQSEREGRKESKVKKKRLSEERIESDREKRQRQRGTVGEELEYLLESDTTVERLRRKASEESERDETEDFERRREERREERRKKEKSREVQPVICEWDLEGPRVLVCKHPILGIIKSRHPQVLRVLDSPNYWDSHYFHCEVFYDHEIYNVCDPHGDDAEYEDQMIDWDAEENVNFKGLL